MCKALFCSLGLVVMQFVAASAHAVIVADSVADYPTQGLNGWFYGVTDRTLDTTPGYQTSDFGLMPHYTSTDANGFWQLSPGVVGSYVQIGRDSAVPNGGEFGVGGRVANRQWPVRRWISSVSGPHEVRGTFRDPHVAPTGFAQDDGVQALVFLDGQQIFSTLVPFVGGIPIDFSIDVMLQPGSIIDFAIDPRTNPGFDDTRTSFQVLSSPVPEPSAALLLWAGLAVVIGCVARRRWRRCDSSSRPLRSLQSRKIRVKPRRGSPGSLVVMPLS